MLRLLVLRQLLLRALLCRVLLRRFIVLRILVLGLLVRGAPPLRAPRPSLSEFSATADAAAFRPGVPATVDDAAPRVDVFATAAAVAFRSDISANAKYAAAFRRAFSATADNGELLRDIDVRTLAHLCSAVFVRGLLQCSISGGRSCV